MERGITQGEHAKAVAVAESMKALGISADVIEKVSGLPPDEISKL
jgi:hypothetical protein